MEIPAKPKRYSEVWDVTMTKTFCVCLMFLLAAVSAHAQDPGDPAVYRDRGAWLAAVAAAGITTPVGTQTFEDVPVGLYINGLPDPGGTVGFSTGSLSAVSVAQVNGGGHVLRPQVSAYIYASPFVLPAIGFDLQIEPALPCATGSNSAWVFLTMAGRSLAPQYAAIAMSKSFIGFVMAEGTAIVDVLVVSIDGCGNGDAITLLDNVSYPGGAASSPTNPNPTVPCPPGQPADAFCFAAPDGPAWYDPPPTNTYDFSATDAKFISINDFPPGFAAPFTVTTGGVTLGSFTAGQRVDFPDGGVHEFRVSGITPEVDGANPLAFPINLSLDTVGAIFTMRPVSSSIDATPPVIAHSVSPAPVNGWNKGAVTVGWTVDDPESGIASRSGCTGTVLNSETAGTLFTCSATNTAGLSSSDSVTLKIDGTAPAIALTSPADGVTYVVGSSVVAAYSCADVLSGVTSCAGPIASGSSLDTSLVAQNRTFTVASADVAGNVATRGSTYNVIYGFSGFSAPIQNLPNVNALRAGRSVPVKWQLRDASGVFISDLGTVASLTSSAAACDGPPVPLAGDNALPSGASALRFDISTQQFVFNWQTSISWTGCRVLQLILDDGTTHVARFSFR
jgi:hypothetical protein